MSELQTSALAAQNACQSLGFYFCAADGSDEILPNYTVDLTDDHAVAFLRRLLTADIKELPTGGVTQSFVLNALGLVTDFVTVAHMEEKHYRVIFQSIDTLAWMHQVAKAFDVDFIEPKVNSVVVFGQKRNERFPISKNHCAEFHYQGEKFLVLSLENRLIIQGSADAMNALKAIDAVTLDAMSANTLLILADEPHAMDWMTGDVTPTAIGGARYLNFTDPARMFIGRALTEARYRAEKPKKTVILKSHDDKPKSWFEDPQAVTIAMSDGTPLYKTMRVGVLGNALIARVALDQSINSDDCLWLYADSEDSVAFRVDTLSL